MSVRVIRAMRSVYQIKRVPDPLFCPFIPNWWLPRPSAVHRVAESEVVKPSAKEGPHFSSVLARIFNELIVPVPISHPVTFIMLFPIPGIRRVRPR